MSANIERRDQTDGWSRLALLDMEQEAFDIGLLEFEKFSDPERSRYLALDWLKLRLRIFDELKNSHEEVIGQGEIAESQQELTEVVADLGNGSYCSLRKQIEVYSFIFLDEAEASDTDIEKLRLSLFAHRYFKLGQSLPDTSVPVEIKWNIDGEIMQPQSQPQKLN